MKFRYTTSHVVEFYEWKRQEYAGSLTRAECGEHCTEADQVSGHILTSIIAVFINVQNKYMYFY